MNDEWFRDKVHFTDKDVIRPAGLGMVVIK